MAAINALAAGDEATAANEICKMEAASEQVMQRLDDLLHAG